MQPAQPTQPPPQKKIPKDVFRCTYCQYKDNSIDKLHVSLFNGSAHAFTFFDEFCVGAQCVD